MSIRISVNRGELQKLLDARGWTQSELARQMNTDHGVVSRFFREQRNLSLQTYLLLKELFPDDPQIFIEHRDVHVVSSVRAASRG